MDLLEMINDHKNRKISEHINDIYDKYFTE